MSLPDKKVAGAAWTCRQSRQMGAIYEDRKLCDWDDWNKLLSRQQ